MHTERRQFQKKQRRPKLLYRLSYVTPGLLVRAYRIRNWTGSEIKGNSNLIYTMIRKRQVFHALASLPTDAPAISRVLTRHGRKPITTHTSVENLREGPSMEGSHPAQPAQPGTQTVTLAATPGVLKMTEQSTANPTADQLQELSKDESIVHAGDNITNGEEDTQQKVETTAGGIQSIVIEGNQEAKIKKSPSMPVKFEKVPDRSPSVSSARSQTSSILSQSWQPTPQWVLGWKKKLPLQTIMRMLQVLVPQVEKICIDKGLTDESEILKFLQHGTLVGLLPVPHPILIRKYQANSGTAAWFRTYMWGVIYLRNIDPPIWYDTAVRLFEIQRV
ncbi:hypothetical protein QYM36_008774 [Artemia franciscana]|uniref:Protein HID1 n=1 Tax=Artemia franciscana TaxID=6661 RepID=A0AA88HRF7_ARTSF|nr:hypothetical protein QYM36_008774 [Artemia franciscana]